MIRATNINNFDDFFIATSHQNTLLLIIGIQKLPFDLFFNQYTFSSTIREFPSNEYLKTSAFLVILLQGTCKIRIDSNRKSFSFSPLTMDLL